MLTRCPDRRRTWDQPGTACPRTLVTNTLKNGMRVQVMLLDQQAASKSRQHPATCNVQVLLHTLWLDLCCAVHGSQQAAPSSPAGGREGCCCCLQLLQLLRRLHGQHALSSMLQGVLHGRLPVLTHGRGPAGIAVSRPRLW